MAENGNRGPNDPFRRSGRRRREPPIIDAAATEVPFDPTEPGAPGTSPIPDPRQPPAADVTSAHASPEVETPRAADETPAAESPPPAREPSPVGEDAVRAHPAEDEPVLFGSAVREPPRRSEAVDDASATPNDAMVGAPEASPAPDPAAMSPDPSSLDPIATDPIASAAESGSPPRSDAMPPPPVRSGASALAGVLGAAAVVLLGVVGWLVYSDGQRGSDLAATIADLKTKVSALEARPDPGPLQAQVAALDQRVAAADAERTALGKTVSALSSRLDTVSQQAQASAAKPAQAAAAPPPSATGPAQPAATPAFATLGAVAALAAKVEGLDGRMTALASDQAASAKAAAALPKPAVPDFGPVNGKLAALESRINAVDGKINGSDARFNGFDAKVNAVDTKINGFDAKMNGLDDRMNGLESKADDGAAQATKLQSIVANLPKIDIGPLQAATAALDGRIVNIESQLAAPKDGARVTDVRAVGSADETKATPIALVGQSIERAIATGRPYGADIDALKALGAEPDVVARLQPPAAAGVPSVAALKTQWEGVRNDVLAAVKPAESSGNPLDRLAANALSIVQVRRVGAVAGDDPGAIVSRIDAALDAGDVTAALAAWNDLPEAGKTPSRAWADAARGRSDALAAARDLVSRAIATLGRTKS